MKLYTEEQVNELMVLLQQSFLPENIECDGAHCMGCWKDVVRETLKKMVNITPIELPSDEEIEKQTKDFMFEKNKEVFYNGAKWVIEKIKQQDNEH